VITLRRMMLILCSVALVILIGWMRPQSAPVATGLAVPSGGSSRVDGRFANHAGEPDMPGIGVTLPFFARRIWVTLKPRPGAAAWMKYDSSAIKREPSLTWIGHSTFLVRMDGVTFLTDPMFSDRASPVSFTGPRRLIPPGVPLEALPAVTFVLLSHDHYDHADWPSVKRLAERGVRFVVPLGLGEWVRSAGGQAIELDWWREIELDGVRIHSVPAQHFSGRSLRDQRRRLWAGWVVSGPTRRFYYAGDTGYSADFREIGERLGPIDLATVPIGAYLPAAMMQHVHVTPEEALQIGHDVRARRIVAMHFGTFDLADEPLDEPPRRFRAEAERLGLRPDRAWILKVGETREW
jgi:N-acyl-phosphatidylethanolamine-hydrolysing phospholipase D